MPQYMTGTLDGPVDVTPQTAQEFDRVIRSRRSVRVFLPNVAIPSTVVQSCLDQALLAPNSSNMQTWQIHRISSTSSIRLGMNKACLSQPAARTASDLFVFVARPDQWKNARRQWSEHLLALGPKAPKGLKKYYGTIIPVVYMTGPFGLMAAIKKILFSVLGLFKPIPRGPITWKDVTHVASKSVALSAMTFMYALRAQGYDSCPMEGFDANRVRKLLKLPCSAHVVMIVGAGKRAPEGVYGERIRFNREQFLTEWA